MQSTSNFYATWTRAPPPPARARSLNSSPNWPSNLQMGTLERSANVVRVGFSLGPLLALTPCELEVGRWANSDHSNAAIASLRQKSIHTVVRQMASLLQKLGIGSRLGLATIAELNTWSPPHLRISPYGSGPLDSWLRADTVAVEPTEVARIWQEIALGNWTPLVSVDTNGTSHVVMRRVSTDRINWGELNMLHLNTLALVAEGVAQKTIAAELGLPPSTVSAGLASACRRLGLPSLGRLLRAYCAEHPRTRPGCSAAPPLGQHARPTRPLAERAKSGFDETVRHL
jgi:DNA-binding CsgD family transcriptional regulator